LKVPFGNWRTVVGRKIYLLNTKKVNFKKENLKKGRVKSRAELKLNLVYLKIIVYLEVLGFVFAATGRILRRSVGILGWEFHPAIQMLLTKSNCRVHGMPHAPMRRLCHSHGGEKQQKR
jgi:hypothetical protein